MKTQHYLFLLFIVLLVSCSQQVDKPITPNIIPKPLSENITDGVFMLDKNVTVVSENDLNEVSNYFKAYVKESLNITFSDDDAAKKIVFKVDETLKNEEGYTLTITENNINITSKNSKGAFYAVQSLLQLLPVKATKNAIAIQCLEIKDEPRFVYRGMHLDVGRHFFSVDFIKKYIDMIASLKMNTFHWHLTEDQGWRIEIKKYPKLQEIAAFRKETLVGSYSDKAHQFDGKEYGGFYTQEEIKDVVKYATTRQVTIIPEIEMPGHAQAALAAYPNLGCTGKQLEVATKWGVFDDIYCSKEETFSFLEDVIDEVITLFPGKYIHIGGDEAPKTRWKKCDDCQRLIKKEGLKDEYELQSYFITRMEKYINSKGKQIIGWDEILEGGLAPNATVMSWRGTAGAVHAAKQKNNVILTPNTHCYFDHYQSENKDEPLAIGGFLPLEKVYSFNPIPEELTKEEEKYVLGAQGNVWTEYIPTSSHVEYMAFPRAIALAEVVWSSEDNRNYSDFVQRLDHFKTFLDAKNINYANHLYEIKGDFNTENGANVYTLKTALNNKEIRFTTDNSEPNKNSEVYKNPIKITENTTINAATFDDDGNKIGALFSDKIKFHKAVGKDISLNIQPNKPYNVGGKIALINGISGNNNRFSDEEWLGFDKNDVEITIDFKKPTAINNIATRFYNSNGNWVYAPKKVLLSFDGGDFEEFSVEQSEEIIINFNTDLTDKTATKLTIKIPNYGIIENGKPGEGNKAWTFIDEIIVE